MQEVAAHIAEEVHLECYVVAMEVLHPHVELADDGSGCGFSSLLQLPDNAFLKGLTLKRIFV